MKKAWFQEKRRAVMAVIVTMAAIGTIATGSAVYARTAKRSETLADAVGVANPAPTMSAIKPADTSLLDAIDSLAARERSEGPIPGLALTESTLRERTGDFAGATIAAFKELRWAYAMGYGDESAVTDEAILERLSALRLSFAGRDDENATATAAASRAASAFVEGRWKEARTGLEALFAEDAEADSFARWMILACRLEEGEADRATRSSYAAISGRYDRFPEYWFRAGRAEAARAKTEPEVATAAAASSMEAAERCVALAPQGPFAEEARSIMAESAGLRRADGGALLTRAEVEETILAAASGGEVEVLERLLPLLSLPDNAYTLYALGAVRGLSAEKRIRAWLGREARIASPRLAERLRYAAGK